MRRHAVANSNCRLRYHRYHGEPSLHHHYYQFHQPSFSPLPPSRDATHARAFSAISATTVAKCPASQLFAARTAAFALCVHNIVLLTTFLQRQNRRFGWRWPVRPFRPARQRASFRRNCVLNLTPFFATLADAARAPPLSSLYAGQNGHVLKENDPLCCRCAPHG